MFDIFLGTRVRTGVQVVMTLDYVVWREDQANKWSFISPSLQCISVPQNKRFYFQSVDCFFLYLRGSLQYVELYWLFLIKIKMHEYWKLIYSKDLTISISSNNLCPPINVKFNFTSNISVLSI